ncbi:MAG: acyltransferase family protein [Firmicutes bacterium]|nr:acyltransferase family protein [Bacillota bacterium]
MTTDQNRAYYLDVLRIIATVAVIILHVSAQNWDAVDIHSFAWHVFNFFDSLVRWAVPVFIMISGAVFLDNDRPLSIQKLYRKNVLRLVIVYFVWATVYAVDKWIMGATLKDVILSIIGGHYHMWFIPMLIGLYLIVPLLRKITESRTMTLYLIVLGVIFTFVIPQILQLINILKVPHTADLLITTSATFHFMAVKFPGVYVLYFVLGYALHKFEIGKNLRKAIYLLGLLGFAATVLLTVWLSYDAGVGVSSYYLAETINVLLMATALFTWAKYSKRTSRLQEHHIPKLAFLSKCTLGVYLIHPLILAKLYLWFSISTVSFQPILGMIIVTAIVTVVSFLLSAILNKIPWIKKYIV